MREFLSVEYRNAQIVSPLVVAIVPWNGYLTPWRRPIYDRKGEIRSLMAQVKAFADLVAKPIKRSPHTVNCFMRCGRFAIPPTPTWQRSFIRR